MVRVPLHAKSILEEMAAEDRVTLSEMLGRVIEQARRQRVIDSTNRFYAELRANPEAWAEEEAERALWETTLSDGLRDE
jgi:hypothetical protein